MLLPGTSGEPFSSEETMLIAKTEAGQQVVKDRSIALTPRQRSTLILVDGKRTFEQLLAATAPAGVTREDVDKLFELGLVSGAVPRQAATAAAPVQAAAAAAQHRLHRSPQERYAEAYSIATRITAGLGLRGFRLNLAVEAATTFDQLLEVAPRIREAVGAEKYGPLDKALNGG
jgi:hypothetical protein